MTHIWWRPHPYYSRNLRCPALRQPTLLLPPQAVCRVCRRPLPVPTARAQPTAPPSTAARMPRFSPSDPCCDCCTYSSEGPTVQVHIWLHVIILVICAQHPGRRLCSLLHLAPDTLDKSASSRSPTQVLGSLRYTSMSTSKSSSASIMSRGNLVLTCDLP